jgi:hypothetical protein
MKESNCADNCGNTPNSARNRNTPGQISQNKNRLHLNYQIQAAIL